MSEALDGLFQNFINWLYQYNEIDIPQSFHDQCAKVQEMLKNDITGVINSILDYSVNTASEAKYRIECSELTLQKLLNLWLERINIRIEGIPTGLQALAKEYFLERWKGSSFCILRLKDWEDITVDNVTIQVPTTMWFVNGSSVYVERPKSENYKLGSDKYFLDKSHEYKIPRDRDEEIIVEKPFDRWHVQYPTPYLVRRGVLKNWMGVKVLQEKTDEIISKILPYLFLIQKGTESLFLQGDVNYSDEDLAEMAENFKTQIQKYKSEKGKTPANVVPFDTKYEHLIPDLRNVLTEELYRQGYRAILAGLGFIDMLEISPSRQETRMNPKAFISETNEGVNGFKRILLEVIYLIEERNKKDHKKLFSNKGKIVVVNSPLKINTEQILDAIRSGFDRGVLSYESYINVLGFDYTTEKERRIKEEDTGEEGIFYPRLLQNREDILDVGIPKKPKTDKEEKLEDEGKKPDTPEADNFKNAELEEAVTQEDLEMAPYKDVEELIKKHPYMKKYPKEALEVFIEVFNKSLPKGEDYAYPVAWSAMKKWLKKNGYKKVGDKWIKEQ